MFYQQLLQRQVVANRKRFQAWDSGGFWVCCVAAIIGSLQDEFIKRF